MQDNYEPALDRDIAEIIRLQKKQLTQERLRTVFVILITVILAFAAFYFYRYISALNASLDEISKSLGEFGSLDLDSLDLSSLDEIADALRGILERLDSIDIFNWFR